MSGRSGSLCRPAMATARILHHKLSEETRCTLVDVFRYPGDGDVMMTEGTLDNDSLEARFLKVSMPETLWVDEAGRTLSRTMEGPIWSRAQSTRRPQSPSDTEKPCTGHKTSSRGLHLL